MTTTAIASSNGYPQQRSVSAVLCKLTGGLPAGQRQVLLTPESLWHRQNFPVGGTTEMRFFNADRASGVTNLAKPGALPANYAFALESISISFLYGIDVAGARVGTAAQTALAASGAVATDTVNRYPALAFEKMRELLSQGEVVLTIGDRTIFRYWGCDMFPAGGGVSAGGAFAAGSAVQSGVMNTTNGVPIRSNQWTMRPGRYPIPADQNFELKINWQNSVDFADATLGPLNGASATNAGVLMAQLEGVMVRPASA